MKRWMTFGLIVLGLVNIAWAGDSSKNIEGVWLPDIALMSRTSKLPLIWKSTLTIKENTFALSAFWNLKKDTTGTFTLGSGAGADHIDLQVNEIDLSPAGSQVQYPACTLPGIYKIEDDRLSICFSVGENPVRPTDFATANKYTVRLELERAPANFKAYPEHVTLKVVDEQGTPVEDAELFDWMTRAVTKDRVLPWKYNIVGATDENGVVTRPYGVDLARPSARDAGKKLMGFGIESPATLEDGEATLVLKTARWMRGRLTSKAFADAGTPVGWTNTYLYLAGERVADCSSRAGEFEFFAPPGAYMLNAYGEDLGDKYVPVVVPAGDAELVVPPIELTATQFFSMIGKPAPEIAEVAGWQGTPTKFSELKGKVILVDFWGYWCGPCVAEMPKLMKLQEKFADRGLAIVGVHEDASDGIDTPAKLDAKLTTVKEKQWGGKSLSFPSALVAAKDVVVPGDITYRSVAAAQYGVTGYPTTILIGRDGKIIGRFDTGNSDAEKQLEKALASPQP